MSANNIRLYLTGKKPEPYDPSNNSITINAAGNNIQANTANSCFITPIRQQSQGNALYYNNTTGEIAYDVSGGSGGGGGGGSTSNSLWDLSGTNFYGPSGVSMNTTNMADKHYNIACGRFALAAFTGGSHNIAIGDGAANSLPNPINNAIIIGGGAVGDTADEPSNVIFIGNYAGRNLYTSRDNNDTVGLGHRAFRWGADYSVGAGKEVGGYNSSTGVISKSVAVGAFSMQRRQANNSVAVGMASMGTTLTVARRSNIVALGYEALYTLGGGADASGNIAIGYEALRLLDNVSNFNIAIGYKASETVVDASNTIVINATGATMDPQDSSRCYIKPIRNVINQEGIPLHYDSTSGQITYGLGPSGNLWNLDANKNFYGPSGESFQGSGINNVVCGKDALPEGNNNVAVGYEAMLRGVGENSVAVGSKAGKGSTGGLGLNRCVAVGYEALKDASDASGCIAVGFRALGEHTLGQRNIAIGDLAMFGPPVAPQNDNIAIGYDSYRRPDHYSGSANIAIGYRTGSSLSSGVLECDGNIGIGYEACRFSGKGNVGFGYRAGRGGTITNTLRSFNINIGNSAGEYQTAVNDVSNSILLSGNNNDVFAGLAPGARLNNSFYCRPGTSGIQQGGTTSKLLYDPSSGEITYDTHTPPGTSLWDLSGGNFWGPSGDSFIMASATVINNVVMGRNALLLSSGYGNVAVGENAGWNLSGTSSNVCIGQYAASLTSGSTRGGNVIVGHYAGARMGNVTGNVAVGYYALRQLSVGYLGDFNIAIGFEASYDLVTLDVSNTIVINATGAALVPQDSSRCYIKPIRNDVSYNSIQSLHYDPTLGEVTYDLNYIPSATAAEGRADALVTQLDPSQNPFLDNSGSKGMMWINQVQEKSNAWGDVASMSKTRYRLGCVALGGKIYALGGSTSAPAAPYSVEVYDPIDNTWNYVAPMDISRTSCTAAALGGKIYAVGGWMNTHPVPSTDLFTNEVSVYDPIDNTWNNVAPLDISRGFLSCAALGGKLYAAGGQLNPPTPFVSPTAIVSVYDPIDNSWNDVASMNTARRNFGLTAAGGKLYAIGGEGPGGFLDTVEVYDPIDNSWNYVVPMDISMNAFGACALAGKLYVVGGTRGSGNPNSYRTTKVYDPLDPSGGWTTLDALMDVSRGYVGAVAMGGRIYAIGGQIGSGSPYNTVEVYDPSLNPQLQVTYQGEDFYVSAQRGGPKTFIIQHPEDPDRLLRHACIEAPTRGTNLYEYQIQTATDNATTEIALPSYFSKLNGRARVYVVPVDVFSRCAGKINEESTIALIHTEKAGTFNVIVTGIRKDPAALEFSSTEMIDF